MPGTFVVGTGAIDEPVPPAATLYQRKLVPVAVNAGAVAFWQNINGLVIKNQIRRIKPIKINNKSSFIIARNNDSLMIIQ